ncbi:alkyl hydroperoxide reductase protein F [Klebsiella pneumoniae]|uniref:Alkyl hydroperoxide reductase protein F n=1 Tax=Klebsiella pneumoniae TaxID=573 RepID=A0A2X3E7J3_KLEPN|nr:alkyl hydroperoxide reductase protein F [Klebsiella pneumoniae]
MGERFGGQVLDTVDIENYISVPKTEGQKLAGALKAHVNDYNVDVIDSQSATKLTPRRQRAACIRSKPPPRVLKARSVIIATGAKWRNMNVPAKNSIAPRA